MLTLSLLYTAITILLAGVDSLRIKKEMGKEANIDHGDSVLFAGIGAVAAFCLSLWIDEDLWQSLCSKPLAIFDVTIFKIFAVELAACACIRFALYDAILNKFRRLPLTYASSTTSSWIDQHIKLSFWQKRALAVVGWAILFIVYYKITK